MKHRKHDARAKAAKAVAENTTPDDECYKEHTPRVTRSTVLASKPSVHGRVRRLWR